MNKKSKERLKIFLEIADGFILPYYRKSRAMEYKSMIYRKGIISYSSKGITGIFDISNNIDGDDIYKEGNSESDFNNDFVVDSSARMRCFYVDWDDVHKCWRW
jgi:hypothetical protein